MELSIVVPVYNEEANVPLLVERLENSLEGLVSSWECIFVNDGSRDRTLSVVVEQAQKNPRIKFIDFSRNFGHQLAVTAGLDHAQGDAVVIIDADLQDPPELIRDLYAKMKEGYEVVYAKRKTRHGESFLKKLTAKIFYRVLQKMTTIEIPVDTGDFRIIDRKVVDTVKKMPELNKYLRGQIAWVGFRQTYVEYERSERNAGKTGYTFRKMFHLALDGITGFSDVPLKLATLLGFAVSSVSFVVLAYSLYAKFISKNFVIGWTSIMVSVLFLGGVQLISLGIIGEYISRINSQVRNRPPYIIRDSNIG